MGTRREFLKSCLIGSGSLYFWPHQTSALPSRSKKLNPFVTPDGKPKLVCVEGYNVGSMLSKGLQALGGVDKLAGVGRDVLIKPNLVLRETMKETPQFPTMSSPDTIRELIYILKGLFSLIRVGDQGGEDQSLIYEKLNLTNIALGAGAELINFEDNMNGTYNVRSNTWSSEIPDFQVFAPVYDASVIINLCNLKRHSSAYMTCAIKNNFGALQGRWNIGTREYIHRNPNLSDEFIKELSEIAALINPELTIVDARDIMIGNGPILSASGAAIKRGINRLILSGDMVAVDAYCAEYIMKKNDPTFSVETIRPTLEHAKQLGLGTSDLNQVNIQEIDESWELRKKGYVRR